MDFYESMRFDFSEKLRASVTPSDEERQSLLAERMNSAACRAPEDVRRVLDDDHQDDPSCVRRIEEIVKIYKPIGSDAGSHHDF